MSIPYSVNKATQMLIVPLSKMFQESSGLHSFRYALMCVLQRAVAAKHIEAPHSDPDTFCRVLLNHFEKNDVLTDLAYLKRSVELHMPLKDDRSYVMTTLIPTGVDVVVKSPLTWSVHISPVENTTDV